MATRSSPPRIPSGGRVDERGAWMVAEERGGMVEERGAGMVDERGAGMVDERWRDGRRALRGMVEERRAERSTSVARGWSTSVARALLGSVARKWSTSVARALLGSVADGRGAWAA